MNRAIVVTAVALGILAAGLVVGKGGPAGKGGPTIQTEGRCPLIYGPVLCPNGKTYVNSCVAEQHHQFNCTPVGP